MSVSGEEHSASVFPQIILYSSIGYYKVIAIIYIFGAYLAVLLFFNH